MAITYVSPKIVFFAPGRLETDNTHVPDPPPPGSVTAVGSAASGKSQSETQRINYDDDETLVVM